MLSILSSGKSIAWAADAACQPFDQEARKRITLYVSKLIKAPQNTDLTLESAEPYGDSCFRRLEFILAGGKDKFKLFLSPDQRFVSPQLYDSTIDPIIKQAEEIRSVESTLNRYLALHRRPSLGSSAATVTIVMFVDLQCPFSRKAVKTLRAEILPKDDDLRLVLLQYPLRIHSWAFTGSLLTTCVAQQRQPEFWAVADYILENQDKITGVNGDKDLISRLMPVNLFPIDKLQLSRCLKEQATEQEIAADLQLGSSLRIQSTPTTFINGTRLVGLFTAEMITTAIRSAKNK